MLQVWTRNYFNSLCYVTGGCNFDTVAELSVYRVITMEREDSPDLDGVGYIEEDHPLRPSLAAQSIALLQLPDRSVSMSSSLADQDAPMFPRETTYRPAGHQVSHCSSFFFLVLITPYHIMSTTTLSDATPRWMVRQSLVSRMPRRGYRISKGRDKRL